MIGWGERAGPGGGAREAAERKEQRVEAAARLLWWSFLSGSYSQRCHGPRGGRRARRQKPAPGGAR